MDGGGGCGRWMVDLLDYLVCGGDTVGVVSVWCKLVWSLLVVGGFT